MNSQRKIEINQSSLLGLKAELLRKKNEISNAKYSQEVTTIKAIKKKLTTKLDKANEGVTERDSRDAEEIQEESDQLKKSQNMLVEKAKLYDQLMTNPSDVQVSTAGFLVDFNQKSTKESIIETKDSESDYEDYAEDEEEWVDFVDCLGRTKRCHKDDLQAMKGQDEKLRFSLHGKTQKEPEKEVVQGVELPQLCSEDMKREILRQKWEEQERNLLDKKNIHYQDVLFDEARTHGVGYYGFSTDEGERLRQQEALRKLRKETEENQAEAQTAAQKKQRQMEERLRAARRRKRERLGLPPEEETHVPEVKEEKKPEPPEELRRDVRKPTAVRPWDVGKERTSRILTQEEWVEKKRSERPEEFAPPSFPIKKRKFQRHPTPPRYAPAGPSPPDDDSEKPRARRVEIPPPPIFDLYGSTFKPRKTASSRSVSDIDKSIEAGLNFLRKKVEEKQAKRRVDEIDIM